LVLDAARKRNVVLPSKERGEDEKIKGAFVFDPKPGLYENIAVLDMKSLYPSIMISFNLGYETFIEKPDLIGNPDIINIDNKYYYSKNESLIKEILKDLIKERAKLKKQMKEVEWGSQEYKSLDSRQYAVKVMANAIYGVIGYQGFRLFNSKVAETVTYMGRKIIHYVIDLAKEKGFETVYSDTDSIFIRLENRTLEDVKVLANEINSSFDGFVKQFGIESHNFEIQFEKVFGTVFFTSAKKRYAGLLKWKDGKDMNLITVTGFEVRRSDSPQIGRDFQKELFGLILNKNPKKEVKDFVENFKEKIRLGKFSSEQIGLPVGISKEVEKYKNMPIHIRAVNNANKYHNANFNMGDKIKYLYVKSGKCNDNVIAFKDKLWDGYVIDTEKMIERIVDNKVKMIFEALGWEDNKSKSLMEFM
jgi:DNA polymerase I